MAAATPTTASAQARSGRPAHGVLLRWLGVVLAAHLLLLLNMAGALDWQLKNSPTIATGPLQTRIIPAPGASPSAAPLNNPNGSATAARTRIAVEAVPVQAPSVGASLSASPSVSAVPSDPFAHTADKDVITPDAEPRVLARAEAADTAMPPDFAATESDAAPANETLTHTTTNHTTRTPTGSTTGSAADTADNATRPEPSAAVAAERPALANAQATPNNRPADPAMLALSADTAASDTASTATTAVTSDAQPPVPLAPATATSTAATTDALRAAPEAPLTRATRELPSLPLSAMPPSALLSYRLNGQEKGLNYSATGELRWQRNDTAYAMSLTVKAFLLGSRHWRSQGLITPQGLAPIKFSDSWRSERAAHFDQPNQRIVFSNNAPTAPLQAGAQDQVSLYVQLAAAMAQADKPWPVGTRLQIQTATVRDALPWLLTLEKTETLQLDGTALQTTLWVCQPRNRFDAQVSFWVAAEHDWLPARIRITQTSGSFIDLQLTGRTPLPDLPTSPAPG